MRQTKIVLWGAVKIKLEKGLMEFMELKSLVLLLLLQVHYSFQKLLSVLLLLSMLFGFQTKCNCEGVRDAAGHGFQFLRTDVSVLVKKLNTKVKSNYTSTL